MIEGYNNIEARGKIEYRDVPSFEISSMSIFPLYHEKDKFIVIVRMASSETKTIVRCCFDIIKGPRYFGTTDFRAHVSYGKIELTELAITSFHNRLSPLIKEILNF